MEEKLNVDGILVESFLSSISCCNSGISFVRFFLLFQVFTEIPSFFAKSD